MTIQIDEREKEIELYRKNKYNVFPIPKEQKGADTRYDSEKTARNQVIKPNENYGIIGTLEGANGTVDFDDKEFFRGFIEKIISKGCKVIESPHGWHVPYINIGNSFGKVYLWNKTINPDKAIIEIMTNKTYVLGMGSLIHEDKNDNNSKLVTYKNVGSDKFWDLKGLESGDFIDYICKECNVKLSDDTNVSQNQKLRLAFTDRKYPTGNSNDYFLQASRVCYWTENLEREEAYDEIKKVYEEWKASKYYSNRSWSNCKTKIDEIYDNPKKWQIRSGKKFGSGNSDIDRTEIAMKFLKDINREFFSDKVMKTIWENKGGYLEQVNDIIPTQLFNLNPKLERADISEIIYKIMLGSNDMPLTNKDLIYFKSGMFDTVSRKIIKTEEIADMAFPEYNWLEATEENEPKMFLKFFDSYPKESLPRFYAGIKGIFNGYLDSRISVLVGISRVGKTTITSILCKAITKRYGFSSDLDTLLDDKFTLASVKGMRLLVIQDLPDTWKKFSIIKILSGESQTSFRGFHEKLDKNQDNKLKIFATGNLLPPIKKSQKNAMYSDRLSILHNIETKMFKSDNKLEDKILEAEAEKIISWCVNIPDSKCQYEDGETVRDEWEDLANPHYDWLNAGYYVDGDSSWTVPVVKLCDSFKAGDKRSREISVEAMIIALKELGYTVRENICKNITEKRKVGKGRQTEKGEGIKPTDSKGS